jgi:hypothetical protein
MEDVAAQLARRVQLAMDRPSMYLMAAGWNGADFAQLVKTYGAMDEKGPQRRYSPAA